MKNEFCIIIPALKKSAVIPDQLVKKLNGITLIQRAINTATKLVVSEHIYVVTDSQEISLICERNKVNYYYRNDLRFDSEDIIEETKFFITKRTGEYKNIIIFQSNTPLVSAYHIQRSYQNFVQENADILLTIKRETHRIWQGDSTQLYDLVFNEEKSSVFVEFKSYLIISSNYIQKGKKNSKIIPTTLDNEEAIEITNYQDWWICEKLLQRKRILFVVAGHTKIGMGHIYRALTLAHEIHNHEIHFLCTKESELAIQKIAKKDYPTHLQKHRDLTQDVLNLRPDLVINDFLNTDKSYIQALRAEGVKVANFEDLGSGAKHADMTFNELYDEPLYKSSNTYWGSQYLFLRNEFEHAKPRDFHKNVECMLITFGGTDPNNYTQTVLELVLPICQKYNIKICLITGKGFEHKKLIEEYLENCTHADTIEYFFATDIISKIMEKVDIAISSNGRTVYELAHMNIPSIIISHHAREKTHKFACAENGFLNLGMFQDTTHEEFQTTVEYLISNELLRKKLYDSMKLHQFMANKSRVVSLLLDLLSS